MQINISGDVSKFNGLDHLRAFAITFVFASHLPVTGLPNWAAAFFNLGWSGVDLFFVLSGFLIATQLFNTIGSKNWIGRFYIKRICRILPAYFVVVALYFLIPVFREGKHLAPLWRFLTFTQNILPHPDTEGAFFHAWSLCIEEQFYIVFPFVLFLLHGFTKFKKGWIVISVLFILTCLIRYFIWQNTVAPAYIYNQSLGDLYWLQQIYTPAYTRLDGFLAGISIAAFYKYLPAIRDKILLFGNYLLLVGLIVLLTAFFLSLKRISFTATVFGLPALAIGYGCLVLAALSPNCILFKMKSSVTSFVATLSYSIYLIHRSIIYLFEDFLHTTSVTNTALLVLITTVAVIAAAIILHHLVERPGFRLRDYLLKKYFY